MVDSLYKFPVMETKDNFDDELDRGGGVIK